MFLIVLPSMIDPEEVYYLDKELMEKICHPFAVAYFDTHNDPISQFDEHETQLLESALANPSRSFNGQQLYPTLVKKATILYYGLNKNHPFKNGNKRLATAALLVFLMINNQAPDGSRKEIEDYLVNLALRVADSKGNENRENILKELEQWLGQHLKPLQET